MNHSELHSDLYSVSPAAMSDEQIARRDAMTVTAVSQAESVAAIAASLHSLLDGLCKSVERLERERDTYRDFLREIVHGADDLGAIILGAEKLLAGG